MKPLRAGGFTACGFRWGGCAHKEISSSLRADGVVPEPKHFEIGNHPVCGFAAATPPNLGGDTLTRNAFIAPFTVLPR